MSHYYTSVGEPAHFAGPNGRPTGPATARKLGLLPSVTTILSDVLRKPALERWIAMQNVMAVITAPDVPGEGLDRKVERILSEERQQDEEAKVAADRGSAIHAALEDWFFQRNIPNVSILPWIAPAAHAISAYGKVHACEKILVGEGYAGKCDLLQYGDSPWIWDWKTCKKLPEKGAWNEHRIQASAYAKAWSLDPERNMGALIRTGNVYISTVDCGKFIIHEHDDWRPTYSNAFLPLLTVFKWMNNL